MFLHLFLPLHVVAHGGGWRVAATLSREGMMGRRCARGGFHGCGSGMSGCVRAADGILQAKALLSFLLAAMSTASEGVVLPVGGIIWSPSLLHRFFR